jgi:hypothetical protein
MFSGQKAPRRCGGENLRRQDARQFAESCSLDLTTQGHHALLQAGAVTQLAETRHRTFCATTLWTKIKKHGLDSPR